MTKPARTTSTLSNPVLQNWRVLLCMHVCLIWPAIVVGIFPLWRLPLVISLCSLAAGIGLSCSRRRGTKRSGLLTLGLATWMLILTLLAMSILSSVLAWIAIWVCWDHVSTLRGLDGDPYYDPCRRGWVVRAADNAVDDMKVAKWVPELVALEAKVLDLSDTQVTDLGLQSIVSVKTLEVLYVENTRLTRKSLKALRQMPRLKFVDLRGTEIPNEVVESVIEGPGGKLWGRVRCAYGGEAQPRQEQ